MTLLSGRGRNTSTRRSRRGATAWPGVGAPQYFGGQGLRGRRQDHDGTRSEPVGNTRVALGGESGGGGDGGCGSGDGGGEVGGGGGGSWGKGGDYGAEVVGASLSVIWDHHTD
jgi:hypothetical protein